MKKLNELISVEKPVFSPNELTKQQVEHHTINTKLKKRKSNNIPKPIKRITHADGTKEYIETYEGRCRFKLVIYFKDQFKIGNSTRKYYPSIDGYYVLKDGVKFWYIDEEKSYAKLINLVTYKYRGKIKSAAIYMNISDKPDLSQKKYNHLVFKQVYDTIYDYYIAEKVNIHTGEITKYKKELVNFKFIDNKRFAINYDFNGVKKDCQVEDSFVNILDLKC